MNEMTPPEPSRLNCRNDEEYRSGAALTGSLRWP